MGCSSCGQKYVPPVAPVVNQPVQQGSPLVEVIQNTPIPQVGYPITVPVVTPSSAEIVQIPVGGKLVIKD